MTNAARTCTAATSLSRITTGTVLRPPDIRDDIHEAFMTLAAATICWRHLTR
jgi:hypothetical protein